MSAFSTVIWFVVAGAGSATATFLVQKLASRFGWWSFPTPRGLHLKATLSRGGVGLVLVSMVALVMVLPLVGLRPLQVTVLVGAALGIAVMGFIDDAYPLPILPRLGFQFAMAGLGFWALNPLSGLGMVSPTITTIAGCLVIISWVWSVNLFNFMDGIDGLVATGVFCIAITLALLTALTGHHAIAIAWAALGGACAGLLPWNWPPAQIFMGDVGSGYLGFVVGILAILSVYEGAASIWTISIVGSPFLVDATFTLLRRMFRGDRWYHAHRQHAYQKLAIRWSAHRPVTALLLGVQLVVVAPLASLGHFRPGMAPLLAIVVSLALCLAAWRVGAGVADPDPN